jgi:hypothetical protein
VEILAAIAIIAILIGLLYVGAKYIGASSRGRKTQVLLKNLEGMLVEFQSRGGRMEILTDPYNGGGSNPTTGNRETMPHGSVEGELAYSNAQLTPALKRTQNVMAQLLTVPTNKSILNKLPPEVFMKDPSTNQAMYPPVLLDAWNSPILFAPGRGTLPPADVQWGVAGMYVTGDPNSPSKDNPSTWNAFFKPADGKGMFVSAGEDTDFSKGDDNLYSFEK